jgi:hypothetical protein
VPVRPVQGHSETASFICLACCSYFDASGRLQPEGRGGDLPALRNFYASKLALICGPIPFRLPVHHCDSASFLMPRMLHVLSIDRALMGQPCGIILPRKLHSILDRPSQA